MAKYGEARQVWPVVDGFGGARHGRHGEALRGRARLCMEGQAWRGVAERGGVGQGRHGSLRIGLVGSGVARQARRVADRLD